MSAFNIFRVLIDSSGSLLYFLAAIVLSLAALLMAATQRLRGSEEQAAGHHLVAGIGILAGWAIVLVGAAVALANHQSARVILPPLDWAISVLVVLALGWAFVSADDEDPPRLNNILTLALGAVLLGSVVVTGYSWANAVISNTDGGAFSLSRFAVPWALGGLAIVLLEIVLLVRRARQVVDLPLKLLALILLALGFGATLYGISVAGATSADGVTGDASGTIRLATLAALAIWVAVVYRLVISRLSQPLTEDTQEMRPVRPVNSPYSRANKGEVQTAAEREAAAVLRALGEMLAKESPDDIPLQLAIAAANALKADMAAIMTVEDSEYADVIAAYDNITQQSINALAIKRDEQPSFNAAIQNKVQVALIPPDHLNELVDLYTRLDVQRVGPVYFQPLTRNGALVGVLLVGLPYSQRTLREGETQLLSALAPILSRLLAISRAARRSNAESAMRALHNVSSSELNVPAPFFSLGAPAEMEAARRQITELSDMVRSLQIELDYERSRLTQMSGDEGQTISQQILVMNVEREQLVAEREKLAAALQESQARIMGFTGDQIDDPYAPAIDALQRERDELQAQKDQLEKQLIDIRTRGAGPAPAVLRRVLETLAEEKARLQVERNQMAEQLLSVEEQMRSLGIDGPAGLTQLVARLTEEKNYYQTLADKHLQERDRLMAERNQIIDREEKVRDREKQLIAVEGALRRLAQDREAMASQRNAFRQERDVLRQERDGLLGERESWLQERAHLTSAFQGIQHDLAQVTDLRNRLQGDLNRVQADRATLQTERDQLTAMIQGDPALLNQFGADGIDALKGMIDTLTEERSDLEYELLRAKKQIQAMEAALTDARDRLQRESVAEAGLQPAQADMMLSIAQEMRTPMGSIVGYLDLLLSESIGILGESQRQFIQRIRANQDRLSALIEDFIRITAIDANGLRFQPVEIDPVEAIDDAITVTRSQFREKGITLQIDVPDRLPSLIADRDALQQIVTRLLNNAYLASPTDGQVAISARRVLASLPSKDHALGKPAQVADSIVIAVSDQGGGIPQEEQARVFNRLYRTDNPTVKGLGDTGVGLSVARALAESHGGYIWLESRAGVGSTFTVAIPLRPLNVTPTTAKSSDANESFSVNHATP